MTRLLLEILTLGAVLSSLLVITSKNPVIAVVFLISLFINTAGYLILLGIGFVGLSYIIIYIGAITVLFLFIIMMINIRLVDILEIGSEYTKNLPLAIILGLLFVFELFSVLPFTFNNIFLLNLPLNILNNLNNGFAFLLTEGVQTSLPLGGTVIEVDGIFDKLSIIKGWFTEESGGSTEFFFNFLNYGFNFIDSFILNFSQIEILGLGLYTSGSLWLFICSFILLLAMLSVIFLSSHSTARH